MKSIRFSALLAFAAAALAAVGERVHAALTTHMNRSGLILNAVPTIEDFNRSRVTNGAQSEVFRQRLWDWQLYAAAGTTQQVFFSQPAGQGFTTSLGATPGQAKSAFDTNLDIPNTLPSGKSMLVESIEVIYLPGSVSTTNTYTPANLSVFAAVAAASVTGALNDVNTFYQSGLLELNVLSKNYLREGPLACFPPKAWLDVSAATASNSATTAQVSQSLAKASGRPYYLEPTVTLQPAVNFDVTLRWPGVVAVPSGFNARVGVILDGYQLRASQ